MPGPLRHIGELAKARATKRSSERDDGQALAELEARPVGLPAGSRSNGSASPATGSPTRGRRSSSTPTSRGCRCAACCCAAPTLPDPAALERFVKAPGEVAGVLVGHTHFDHAVDAPAIARRFGCRAYGSDSLVTLMGLHGLAEQTVEVEPYRTYELGPFEVSFTPSVHSKLLLGLAVPYDGDLTCEHLDGLSPGAYRCGQVWGISIRVAGLLLYHQGSANLIDDAIRQRDVGDVDVFLAGVAGRSFTRDYWGRILPLLNPRTVVPTHYDNFFRPLGRAHGVRRQRPARASCPRRSARSAATSRSPPCPAPTSLAAVLGGDLLDRAHRPHRPGPELGLERLQVEVGFADAAARQPVELRALDREAVLVGGHARAPPCGRACRARRAAGRPGACPPRPRARAA